MDAPISKVLNTNFKVLNTNFKVLHTNLKVLNTNSTPGKAIPNLGNTKTIDFYD